MSEAGPDSARRFVGTELSGGRFVVSGVLGEGAQAATLEGIDKRDGTLVAIKRFQVRGARSWKDVELAEREAQVLAQLSHELLPTALAHFEQDGALYLVMERIEGETLAAARRLSRDDVVGFLFDADRVLSYLHGQVPAVIHRDIKPSNVIRRPSESGRPDHVLVDFGSVRASLKPSGGSTVVGTFGYMAPEQFQGRALPQSDVYSVGATAIAMLTGSEPEDLPHKGLAIDVRALLPGDRALAEVLERMLEPNPDERPARIGPLLEPLRVRARPKAAEAPRKKERKRERTRDEPSKKQPRPLAPAPSGPLPPLVRPFVGLAMIIARIAVMLTLRALVPTLLTLLSVVFGESLRRAARSVDRAGSQADVAMLRTSRRLTSEAASLPEAPNPKVRIDAAPGRRVADVEPERHRMDLDGAMKEAEREVAAALEEVADEIEEIRGKKKKKRRRGKG